MADVTSMPAGTDEVKTEGNLSNTNPNPIEPVAPAAPVEPAQPAQPAVDLHGLDPNQLGDIAKFLKGQGGFEALKFRMSNPEKTTQPEQPQQTQPQLQQQPQAQQPESQRPQPPKGYASLQELQVKSYFDGLSKDPKYANIAEQISNGDILKEMASFGMAPVDGDYNINIDQINRFLALKSASVPAKPATTEVNTTPTADYTPVEGEITSVDQAWQVLRENVMYTSQGMAPNPALAQAEDYLKKAGAFGPVSPAQPTK